MGHCVVGRCSLTETSQGTRRIRARGDKKTRQLQMRPPTAPAAVIPHRVTFTPTPVERMRPSEKGSSAAELPGLRIRSLAAPTELTAGAIDVLL